MQEEQKETKYHTTDWNVLDPEKTTFPKSESSPSLPSLNLQQLEIDFHFDGDTQQIDGNPVLVFGEKYSGEILLRNPTEHQYLVLDMTPDDTDMKVHQLQESKYVMPHETRMVSFEIATSKNRKKPFKMGISVHGGYLL